MLLSQKSSAWILAGLQLILAVIFGRSLCGVYNADFWDLFQVQTWFTVLILIHYGLAVLLALFALWRFELTAIVLLFAIHTLCPTIFFTDLTRNPFFTQIYLLNVWIAFLWIVWLWEGFVNKKLVFPKTIINQPLLIFLGVVSLSWGASYWSHPSSFSSSIFSEGLKNWLFLVVNCYGAFYLGTLIEPKWRDRFIWLTFWVGGLAALYGLMQFYGIEKIWQTAITPFSNRPVSTFGNPNFLSSYLLMLIPLVIVHLGQTPKTGTALFCFLLLLTLLGGVIATMTRSTWVGVLVSLMLLPWVPAVRDIIQKNRRRLILMTVLIAAGVILWPKSRLGGYANPWQRVKEIVQVRKEGGYGPWHQRILIWSSCWNMVKDHPISGKGWGLLELFYPYYQGQMLYIPLFRNFRTHANNAHNEVIEVWSQTGFLGMGIYIWIWTLIIGFGYKCSKTFHVSDPKKSILSWTLVCSALGMLADNFFGNVSLHFAVPGFLFWWQLGLLFGLARKEQTIIPIENNFHKSLITLASSALLATCIWNFCREFQEIRYFRGFKLSKSAAAVDQARAELESAWRWYPKEVNSNYELANVYARLSQNAAQSGIMTQAKYWREKSLWAYYEALNSNCGYDEIYFNLAATEMQTGWDQDSFPPFTVQTPRGQSVTIESKRLNGAIYNFSRAVAINPLSKDGYVFLGNVFIRDVPKYGSSAIQLYRKAVQFFPDNKDFWVNLAYWQIQSRDLQAGYESLKNAMSVDPFYELTRKNVRAVLNQLNRKTDPLLEVEQAIIELNTLVQTKNWVRLRDLFEKASAIIPKNSEIRFILGNACFELRDWQKAEIQYQEALKIKPANLSALANLGLTYQAQNKNTEAIGIYRKILEINPQDENAKKYLALLTQP